MSTNAERDQFLKKVGMLRDVGEQPLHNVIELQRLGIRTLTPAGILYLLARDTHTAGLLEKISGVSPEQTVSQIRDFLVQTYKGEPGSMEITEQMDVLLTQTLREVGNVVNAAGTEHILLALLTMPGASQSDASALLRELKVTPQAVRQALSESAVESRYENQLDLNLSEAYVETESLKKNLINVLSRLTRKTETRVLITGERGSGKHTFIQAISDAIQKRTFKGLPQTKIQVIDKVLIAQLQDPKSREKTLSSLIPSTLYIVDFDELSAEQHTILHEIQNDVAILGIGAPDVATKQLQKKWETVRLSPYTIEEVQAIVGHHLDVETKKANIQIQDTEAVAKLLVRYGQTLFSDGIPGSAIELLKFAIADAKLHGEPTLSSEKLAQIISRHGSHISADLLLKDEQQRILDVEQILNERIIGNDEAKRAVSEALRIRAAGLADEKKPVANFVFLGGSGVGKTEMAKSLAQALFDSEDNLIRLDMSEYQEPHNVARLIGSPPGYVGYEEGGQLTEAVRAKPFSVVLFDEFDKAHPDVLNPLLQVLDDGRLTDGQGRTVDFSNTVIIMTSNHGSAYIRDAIHDKVDLQTIKAETLAWFKSQLRPEFVNRLDYTIVFDPIIKENARKILDLLLTNQVISVLETKHQTTMDIDEGARSMLLEIGFDAELGARPLKRAIKDKVLDPLSTFILQDQLQPGSKLLCTVEDGEIKVKKV